MKKSPEEVSPVYEELSLQSGMETLDVRVGLSRVRMEREKELFHHREVLDHEKEDIYEENENEKASKGTTTLDVRIGLTKSRIENVNNDFEDAERNEYMGEEFKVKPSLEHINEAFNDDEEDLRERKRQSQTYSNEKEKCKSGNMRRKGKTAESIAKRLLGKIDRIIDIFLCRS